MEGSELEVRCPGCRGRVMVGLVPHLDSAEFSVAVPLSHDGGGACPGAKQDEWVASVRAAFAALGSEPTRYEWMNETPDPEDYPPPPLPRRDP